VNAEQAVFLVGGQGTRLGELTRATPKPVLEVAGRPFLDYLLDDADIRYDPSRPSTVPILLMDNGLARRELGFTARTSLDEGLRRTLEWYRRNAATA